MENSPENFNEQLKELQRLRTENAALTNKLSEAEASMKKSQELLLKKAISFKVLNNYSLNLTLQRDEDIYEFIARSFKSIFAVKETWISIYDKNSKELILKATTLSESDNTMIVQRLGQKLLDFRTPVNEETYNMMVSIGIGDPSSLHDISFGHIPKLVSSALERIFGIGWFQGVTLTDKGKLFGGLIVAGFKNQEPPEKAELSSFVEITSQVLKSRQAEKELLMSEKKFREFSDMLPQLIFESDIEGKIIFINKFGLDLLGYTREQAGSGMNILSFIVPEDQKSAQESFLNTLTGSGPIPREFRIIRNDGNQVPLLIHAVLYQENGIGKGVRGTGVDISEIKAAKEELSIERNLLQALIDNLPDRIYAKDRESRFIICNEALVKRMGRENPEEVLGKSDLELIPTDRAAQYRADELSIINTGIPLYNKEETIVFKSGETRYSLSTKVPLKNSRGEIIGIVGIGRDITEIKLAEEELRRKNDQLEKTVSEKDKYFSIIAHDLKSPFNVFLGYTQILSDEIDMLPVEKIREMTLQMRKSALNLYSLLENLLEWSKIKRNITEFRPVLFNLSEKVRECVEMVNGPSVKKNISIQKDIPADISINADLHMFCTIIRNIVTNAIKFTPRGGKITISASPLSHNRAEIKVSDTGIGMDQKLLKNLFSINDEIRRKGTDDEPSTGLGLLLCHEFVEKHGGKISVESEVGKGSTFTITL